MENNFPQIPIELWTSPHSADIFEELVMRRSSMVYQYNMDELYFVLGIEDWEEVQKYPIIVLTWRDQ